MKSLRQIRDCALCHGPLLDLFHGIKKAERYSCLTEGCKAQYYKGKWHTWKEWQKKEGIR